ncbi:MAG: transketolase [Actinomycetota bacterium]|nr:transketolase [Actinomycetota bacterium]
MQGKLESVSRDIRWDIVRMIGLAGSGHPGGSLSCVEILVSLYLYKMNHNPKKPDWRLRDRFVLSKGHAAPALYAVLARCGYFDREELWKLRQLGSILQGHPDRIGTPGVEISTGSLGQGLSAACGMALGLRMEDMTSMVYALVGDGESQEGNIWEAAMLSAHHCLDNLVVITDRNNMQIDGRCCEVVSMDGLADRWSSFGWDVQEVDGHDVLALCDALDRAGGTPDQPSMIIADTVKGKGVSFMENVLEFHGKAPTLEQMEEALKEIERS